MEFNSFGFIAAYNVAKNEGSTNPTRPAMLASMLGASMPVSVLMAQALARREVAGQPAASTAATPSEEPSGETPEAEQNRRIAEAFEKACQGATGEKLKLCKEVRDTASG